MGNNFQFAFRDAYGNVTLYTKNFQSSLKIPLTFECKKILDISINKSNSEQQLVATGNKEVAFFEIRENLFYWLYIPLMMFILLGVWKGFQFAFLAQKRKIEREFGIQKKIAELQIKSLHNQLDPHFTLNLINSIGSLFISQKTEQANYYFGKYAKLLREMIMNSDKIEIPLKEELDYCKTYLQLEQFRMGNKFDFEFNIHPNVNLDYAVPRLILHSFVENSVKHGIRHLLERKGKIEITINQMQQLTICIRDNGIGRKAAGKYSRLSTGKGIKIIDETIQNYSEFKKLKIDYIISDILNENNEIEGTEVLITI
jgi:LytS/YehU family sensor histidine kinase